LSHLFVLNQEIKSISKKRTELTDSMMAQEGEVRFLAQEVQALEHRSESQKDLLNKRLRQLYQNRGDESLRWMFSAQSPAEMDRHNRYLKKMLDSDHQRLKSYIQHLQAYKSKRNHLKAMVGELAVSQKRVQAQEAQLGLQMREKAKILAQLRKEKANKLDELKDLRDHNAVSAALLSYAFFERKGTLRAPVDGKLVREYGTYVDPVYRFRLMHKGHFYRVSAKTEVHAIFEGRVMLAARVPGWGHTVIVDHGDNYHSVYAFSGGLRVREGQLVKEGEVLALSGGESPLFGPGLYFELRHFSDAIDPKLWIQDSVMKTAGID
jgi:septal ring factor EnvC (AmiA/AmiB activator)